MISEQMSQNITAWVYYSNFDQGKAWISLQKADGTEVTTRRFVRMKLDGNRFYSQRKGEVEIQVPAGDYYLGLHGTPCGPWIDRVDLHCHLAAKGYVLFNYETVWWKFT